MSIQDGSESNSRVGECFSGSCFLSDLNGSCSFAHEPKGTKEIVTIPTAPLKLLGVKTSHLGKHPHRPMNIVVQMTFLSRVAQGHPGSEGYRRKNAFRRNSSPSFLCRVSILKAPLKLKGVIRLTFLSLSSGL